MPTSCWPHFFHRYLSIAKLDFVLDKPTLQINMEPQKATTFSISSWEMHPLFRPPVSIRGASQEPDRRCCFCRWQLHCALAHGSVSKLEPANWVVFLWRPFQSTKRHTHVRLAYEGMFMCAVVKKYSMSEWFSRGQR